MLTSHDVGQRVSVRRRVEGGLTDVLGHLLDVTDDHLDVLCKGAVLSLPTADVTAAKVVPPATPRRGWEVPSVSADDMQRICWAGWPARETERLGDWALRAHDGITGRANSAMAVGDPGRPVPEALRQVASWYAGRGLPRAAPAAARRPGQPGDGRRGLAPAARHRRAGRPDRGRADRAAGPPDDLRSVVEPVPSADWLALMHDLDTGDPEAHVAILTGPDRVGFATLYRGDEPVGIGRVSVEGVWAGVTSVDVAPSARRRGHRRRR